MKRKLLSVLLIISLVFLLFSCDGSIVDIMKKMGNNVAGVDNEAVTSAVESVAVNNSIKVNNDDDDDKVTSLTIGSSNTSVAAYKFTYGEDKTELFTVGTTNGTGSKENVIAIAGTGIKLGNISSVDLSKVTSVLPPQSLDTILSTLDGNGKDELLKELKKEITDETTKKAAEGTKTVLLALLEQCQDSEDDDNIVNNIIANMKETKLTVGDLIVLQSITNIIADASKAVIDVVSAGNFDNALNLLDSAYDTVVSTASIINSVSGTTTILNGVDLSNVISNLMSNKE